MTPFPSAKTPDRKLILVKLDQIGDYVLFRNFLEIIKNSPEYGDHELTLLGNLECRDLAESLDRSLVDQFIWLDKQRYTTWKFCRKRFHAQLKQMHFDILISPLYSRENCWTEPIVAAIPADTKIGSVGDLTNITAAHRFVADQSYTRLVPARDGVVFEFLRNKEFFENLFGRGIELKKPQIVVSSSTRPTQTKYAVLFPGATGKYRRWSEEKFAQLADYLSSQYQLQSVICGSRQDRRLARKIRNMAGAGVVVDRCGKTRLGELPAIFQNAQLVVTNDTSAHHIAAAVGAKTVCLSNGNTFGRFVPYPKEVNDTVRYAYPPEIEHNLRNFHEVVEEFKYASRIDINLIATVTVKSLIDELLSHKHER